MKLLLKLLVLCGLLATCCTATTVSADKEECVHACPDNYDPLCATNGEGYKEFSNACDLRAVNCRLERSALQKYEATDMDWCWTELVDFDSLNEKLGNLDLESDDCLRPCPLIYNPVCISNGKYRAEASNQCIMDGFNCALAKKGAAAFKVLQHSSC